MKKEFDAQRLDVATFAQAGDQLGADEPLAAFERLSEEATTDTAAQDGAPRVTWQALGEMRANAAGKAQPWLHVEASAVVPLTCQRCLQPMAAPLKVDRWFRFVADEQAAAAEDDEAEEDVLALSRSFDLRTLVEDELIMELPISPRHERCPNPVNMTAQDEDFDAAQSHKPNPFAALEQLRQKDSGGRD